MDKGIKTISHSTEYIGLIIKSTKISYTWKLILDSSEVTIVALVSKLTSKVIILANGVVVFQGKKPGKYFSHEFCLHNYSLSITQTEAFYDLFIDGLSFLVMHNRQGSTIIPDSAGQSFLAPKKLNQFFVSTIKEKAE